MCWAGFYQSLPFYACRLTQRTQSPAAAESSSFLEDAVDTDCTDVVEAYYSTDGLWYPAKILDKIEAGDDTDDPQQVGITSLRYFLIIYKAVT